MRLLASNEVGSFVKIALIIVLTTIQWTPVPTDSLAINQQVIASQSIELKTTEAVSTQPSVTISSAKLEITKITAKPRLDEPRADEQSTSPSHVIRHDHRRPIWALAHMVNSIKELELRLGTGANAIEADVTFARDGVPQFTYHGPPCDCWRHCHQQEDFNEYLGYIREIAIEEEEGIGRNLTLLFLDLKLDYLDQGAKIRAGIELAKSILNNLFVDTTSNHSDAIKEISTRQKQDHTSRLARRPFHLILSVNHVTDIDLIHNFIHQLEVRNSSHLMDRIGFDVGMNDDLPLIDSMWRRFNAGAALNLWQGDGFTNCFSPFYNLERLSKALAKRDQKMGYPAKVYHWTIDLHDRMRESLAMGVDAIMTNHPERLLAILNEPEMAHQFRLANRWDDPFRKLPRARLVGRSGETARYQRSASATSGGFLGNLMDVISSLYNYVREIPYLSFPTKSRLFARSSSSSASSRRHLRPNSPASGSGVTSSINKVRLRDQPEYKLETTSEPGLPLVTASLTKDDSNSSAPILVADSADNTATPVDIETPYEGPKWYTSLVSNVLVSMMKILLPVQ